MMRQWLRYGIIATVFYLVFLIVTAPAVWAAWALVRFTHGVVSLNEAEGTIWYGHGDLVIHYAMSPPQRLGVAKWSVNPIWFVLGKLKVHAKVSGPGMDVEGNLRFGYHSLALTDFTASVPAQLVSTIYSPLSLFSPSGQVRASCTRIALDGAGAHGDVHVQWQGAGSSLSSVRPLGDYRLDIQGKGQSASVQLDTVHGDLALNGQGTWQITSGEFQFTGIAKPLAHASELGPLLQLFGPDTGGGQRRIAVTTRLSPLKAP